MRELFIQMAKQLQEQATEGKQGVYVLRVVADEKGNPALEIALCAAVEEKGVLVCQRKETYLPHVHIYKALDWYAERKSPSTDIAKLWIMASRKTPPNTPATTPAP